MLTLHRRHIKSCPHASKGWNYTACDCPIFVDGMVAGHRIKRSLLTNDWTRAMRRKEQIERGGVVLTTGGTTLARAIAEFTESRRELNRRSTTMDTYEQTFKRLPEALLARPLATVDTETLKVHIEGRTAYGERPLALASRRNELKHFRALFNWVIAKRKSWSIEENPAAAIGLPQIEELVTQPLTHEEIDRILNAADTMRGFLTFDTPAARRRARALVLVLAYTGLRVGDAARLRRTQLEPSGHLVLRIAKNGVPIKLLLPADARHALEALPAPGGNPAYFFWSGTGKLRGVTHSMWRTITRLGKRAGIENLHPHRFRDTFAVELLSQGADIRTVQKLLGHKSVQTTERHYAHFVVAHQAILDSAVAKLDFTRPAGRPLLVDPFQHRRRNA